MHFDALPLVPFSRENPFHGWLSMEGVNGLCFATLGVGTVVLLGLRLRGCLRRMSCCKSFADKAAAPLSLAGEGDAKTGEAIDSKPEPQIAGRSMRP